MPPGSLAREGFEPLAGGALETHGAVFRQVHSNSPFHERCQPGGDRCQALDANALRKRTSVRPWCSTRTSASARASKSCADISASRASEGMALH
jgi:hypothetical protein